MKHSKLFTCMYGSKLYGTSTPTSDVDLKHVVLPMLGALLVGKPVKNVAYHTNNEVNVRNTQDDVDEEFIPVQVFARDFMKGQTYALELAFAVDGNHAGQQFYTQEDPLAEELFKHFVRELKEKFLTSNIKAMMGYVVNQANIYSLKGERLNLLNELETLFKGMYAPGTQDFGFSLTKIEHIFADAYQDDGRSDTSLAKTFVNEAIALSKKYPKYFKISKYDIGDGQMKPCFIVNEKVFPHTNTIGHSLGVLETMMSKYGTRAEQAREANVDWKAMMHALRIVDEGLELLRDRKITLPFSSDQVKFYLSVKRGEVPIEQVKAELDQKLTALKALEASSTLPTSADLEEDFALWLEEWMFKFYNI